MSFVSENVIYLLFSVLVLLEILLLHYKYKYGKNYICLPQKLTRFHKYKNCNKNKQKHNKCKIFNHTYRLRYIFNV